VHITAGFGSLEIGDHMAEQKPSIGRIVHYQSLGTPGGEHVSRPTAAIITDAEDGISNVDLCVFYPNGFSSKQSIPFSAEPKPGHWNWPPRV